jgi:hypothetical protein
LALQTSRFQLRYVKKQQTTPNQEESSKHEFKGKSNIGFDRIRVQRKKMNKKKIIAIFIITIAVISLLLVIVLAMHPLIPRPTLPDGINQGTLSSVSPPQLAQPGTNTSVPLVWGITISNNVYSGLNLPNGTIIYIVSSTNITSYSNFIIDLSSSVSSGLSAPTFEHGPEVISFSGTILTFKDYENNLCYGLDNAKLMPPAPQPA